MEKAKNKNVNAIKKIWNNPNFKSYSGIILVIIVVSLFSLSLKRSPTSFSSFIMLSS